jgi:formylglycine-generating enzyme required for sulfatase activity
MCRAGTLRFLGLVLGLVLAGVIPGFAMKECPTCHRAFPDNHKFCPYDGKTLNLLKPEQAGRLEIRLSPGSAAATLKIDDLEMGVGSTFSLDLHPGDHGLEIQAQGFQPQKLVFSLAKGQVQKLTFALVPITGAVVGPAVQKAREAVASAAGNPDNSTWTRPEGRDADMIEVRAATFLLGSQRGNPDERPLRRVDLATFWMDRCEVTCAQYQRFLDSVKKFGHRWCHPAEPPNKEHTPFHTYAWALRFSWAGGKPPADMLENPVVLVDWFDAYAFAKWAGKRLPSENEWEAAAGGGDGRDYPWGNTFGLKWANTGDYPLKVGSYPDGASPLGFLDMAGNVAEWTSSCYETDPQEGKPFDGHHGQPIIRGGSWDDDSRGCRISARDVHRSPYYRSTTVGFRCVADSPPSKLVVGSFD